MQRRALDREALSALSNSPEPTYAVGLRTGLTRRQDDRGTLRVLGLLAAMSVGALGNSGSCDPVPERVCRAGLVRQTALSGFLPAVATATAVVAGRGEDVDRASTGLAYVGTPAPLLPFAPPAQRCGARRAEQKARACVRAPSPDYTRSHLWWLAIGEGRVASAALSGLRRG